MILSVCLKVDVIELLSNLVGIREGVLVIFNVVLKASVAEAE
jgi:hypothetical protein